MRSNLLKELVVIIVLIAEYHSTSMVIYHETDPPAVDEQCIHKCMRSPMG